MGLRRQEMTPLCFTSFNQLLRNEMITQSRVAHICGILRQWTRAAVSFVTQGLTNKQIAAVLHYSVKTIEVYLSRLYQKVGCHSRVELVLAAERGSLRGYET